jgi:hypothetical protein
MAKGVVRIDLRNITELATIGVMVGLWVKSRQ